MFFWLQSNLYFLFKQQNSNDLAKLNDNIIVIDDFSDERDFSLILNKFLLTNLIFLQHSLSHFIFIHLAPPTVQPVSSNVTGFYNESITIKFIINNDYPSVEHNNISWEVKPLDSKTFRSIKATSADCLSLQILNVKLSDRGVYKMSAKNEAGTDEATVTVDVFGKFNLF